MFLSRYVTETSQVGFFSLAMKGKGMKKFSGRKKFMVIIKGRKLMSLPMGIRKLIWIQSGRKLVTSFDTLSPDCIGMILVKLPADFVPRCKLVFQLWNTIISSPVFAKLYSDCVPHPSFLIRTRALGLQL